MIKFNSTPRALALAVAALVAAAPALAQKPDWAGQGNGPGNGKQEFKHKDKNGSVEYKAKMKDGQVEYKYKEKSKKEKQAKFKDSDDVKVGAFFGDQHRQAARTYYHEHYSSGKSCPPGLAKKNNGCMPPGQAKKYAVGQPLPQGVVTYPVPQPVVTQLPIAPPGYRYIRVGNDILLVSPQSGLIVDIISGLLG